MYDPKQIHDPDRAVSELLAAILVFALLLALIVLFQVNFVPVMNQQVEYEHSLRAQDDVRSLQSSLYRVTATGAPETVPVELGVTYPERPLLLNPPPVTGRLYTTDPMADGLVIQNVRVPDNPETNQYWASGPAGVGTYESTFVRYDVGYNEYRGSGATVLEGTVLFNGFENADIVASRGGLIDGRRIDLTVLRGEYDENSIGSESVPVAAVSGPTRTVSVRNDANPITIQVRTLLSEEEWVRTLENEPYVRRPIGYADPDGDPTTPNVLTVELQRGVTYELRMSSVAIGGDVDRSDAAYLTRTPARPPSVPEAGGQVTVDVRDAFNNPVSGTNVTYTIESTVNGTAEFEKDGAIGSPLTVQSDEDGVASVELRGTAESARINATIEADGIAGTANYERVAFEVQIGGSGGDTGGEAGEINPNADGKLVLQTGNFYGCNNGGQQCDGAEVTFRANNASKEIADMRINFYQSNSAGSSASTLPTEAWLFEEDGIGVSPRIDMEITGPDVDADQLSGYAANQQHTYRIEFRTFGGGNPTGALFQPQGGDQFAITIEFADGSRTTYFVNGLAVTGGGGGGGGGGGPP